MKTPPKEQRAKSSKSIKPVAHPPEMPEGIPVGIIEQKVILPAAPNVVYQTLTDPKLHAAFTGAPAAGRARVGGKFTAYGDYVFAVYRILKKDKRIVQDWSSVKWPEGVPPSRLDITLTAVPKGTELHMIQTGVPAEDIGHYSRGWKEHYWSPLKEFLARREMAAPSRRRKKR